MPLNTGTFTTDFNSKFFEINNIINYLSLQEGM